MERKTVRITLFVSTGENDNPTAHTGSTAGYFLDVPAELVHRTRIVLLDTMDSTIAILRVLLATTESTLPDGSSVVTEPPESHGERRWRSPENPAAPRFPGETQCRSD